MSSKPPHPVSTDQPKMPLVNGSAIVASASLAFALLVSIVAWIVTHPHKASQAATPFSSVVAVASVAHEDAVPPAPTPRFASAPASAVMPAIQHSDRQDVLLNHIPHNEKPPPLLPPAPKKEPVKEPAQAGKSLLGETYGTQVLFLNNPEAAAETAKREKKLLFVMHISGNFEESCFT